MITRVRPGQNNSIDSRASISLQFITPKCLLFVLSIIVFIAHKRERYSFFNWLLLYTYIYYLHSTTQIIAFGLHTIHCDYAPDFYGHNIVIYFVFCTVYTKTTALLYFNSRRRRYDVWFLSTISYILTCHSTVNILLIYCTYTAHTVCRYLNLNSTIVSALSGEGWFSKLNGRVPPPLMIMSTSERFLWNDLTTKKSENIDDIGRKKNT